MKIKSALQATPVMVLLSILFGGITTVFRYDGYGISDQIEQLPIILRLLDVSYLPHDFFVNASAEFGPRWYFSHGIAALAGTADRLPALFWVLTLLANGSISVISFFFARSLFHKSNLAGSLAAALVMSVPAFGLGYPPDVYQTLLIESTLSIPLIFLAIQAAANGYLMAGTLLTGVAAILHPLFGLEAGALMIASYGVVEFARHRKLSELPWKTLMVSTGILGGFSLLWILPMLSQERIASETFIEIVAFFRHPHHYVPSTFPFLDYVVALGFLTATVVAWVWWRKSFEAPPFAAHFLLALTLLIWLGCLAGYVFVEIIPLRMIVTAQMFRLLFILKWFGLLLFGGSIAHFLEKEQDATAGVLLVSVLSPITAGFVFFSQAMRNWISGRLPALKIFVEPVPILLITVTFLFQFGFRNYLLLILFLLIGVFISFDRKMIYAGVTAGFFLIVFTGIFRERLPLPNSITRVYEDFGSKFQITYSDIGVQGREAAMFALENTPSESVFLTPPAFGQFRLLANRAIVVDFKAFPFQDLAMQEWYDRMATVYGTSNMRGLAMIPPLENSYRNIHDDKLLALQTEYSITHAILFVETETQFPVLFENNAYKIVELSNSAP